MTADSHVQFIEIYLTAHILDDLNHRKTHVDCVNCLLDRLIDSFF